MWGGWVLGPIIVSHSSHFTPCPLIISISVWQVLVSISVWQVLDVITAIYRTCLTHGSLVLTHGSLGMSQWYLGLTHGSLGMSPWPLDFSQYSLGLSHVYLDMSQWSLDMSQKSLGRSWWSLGLSHGFLDMFHRGHARGRCERHSRPPASDIALSLHESDIQVAVIIPESLW